MTKDHAIRRICVFTGSRPGKGERYREAATELGALLASEKIGVVYGGASVGLMGALADAAFSAGAEVIGVIPSWLDRREIAKRDLHDLRTVGTMHERKALMAELSDAFVAMPGGFGTFDELFEVLTWAQIGLHGKPIGLLDIDGFFGPLIRFVDHMIAEGFVAEEHTKLFIVRPTPRELLEALRTFTPPVLGVKWTDLKKA